LTIGSSPFWVRCCAQIGYQEARWRENEKRGNGTSPLLYQLHN
jgi:hypothetical protein